MASVNKAVILGRLGKDVEVRSTNGGSTVANFTVATSRKFKKNEETVEQTQWHNITAFGKLADICGKYLGKGSQVYIEGEIRNESYEKDGVKKYKSYIAADTVQFLDSKNKSESSNEASDESVPF